MYGFGLCGIFFSSIVHASLVRASCVFLLTAQEKNADMQVFHLNISNWVRQLYCKRHYRSWVGVHAHYTYVDRHYAKPSKVQYGTFPLKQEAYCLSSPSFGQIALFFTWLLLCLPCNNIHPKADFQSLYSLEKLMVNEALTEVKKTKENSTKKLLIMFDCNYNCIHMMPSFTFSAHFPDSLSSLNPLQVVPRTPLWSRCREASHRKRQSRQLSGTGEPE